MTEFIKAFEDAVNDPNTKFANDRKLMGFTSSLQKGVWWEPYCGSKKCQNCEDSADYVASQNGHLQMAHACKDHVFSTKILC